MSLSRPATSSAVLSWGCLSGLGRSEFAPAPCLRGTTSLVSLCAPRRDGVSTAQRQGGQQREHIRWHGTERTGGGGLAGGRFGTEIAEGRRGRWRKKGGREEEGTWEAEESPHRRPRSAWDSVCGTPVTKPQAGMRAGAPRGKRGRSAEENKVAVAHLSGSQPGWAGSCVRDPWGSVKF